MAAVLLVILLLLCTGYQVSGHANEAHLSCSRTLAVGQTIMGATAVSSTGRSVVVTRPSGTTLNSGSTYTAGETLVVSLSSTGNEYVIESNQAIFTTSGSCSNKRIYKDNTVSTTSWSVTMPSDGSTVTIFAGFASAKGAVAITNTVSFSAATASPTRAPTPSSPHTISPTANPSTAKPTVPISSSTVAQTLMTYSLEVQLANITKASAVSNTDHLRSAMKSSYSAFYQPYNVTVTYVRDASQARRLLLDDSTKTAVDFSLQFILETTTYTSVEDFTNALDVVSDLVLDGGIFTSKLEATGVVSLAGVTSADLLSQSLSNSVVYGTYGPTHEPTLAPAISYGAQDDSSLKAAVAVSVMCSTVLSALIFCLVKKKKDAVLLITSTYAIIMAVLAIVLVNLWATDNDSALDTGFLGVPTAANLFAYHPQIMISCFFFFQILAISSWSAFSSYLISKVGHVACNTAALISMSYGLYKIVKYCVEMGSAGFVSLHSWIGLLCAIVFSFNYLYGMCMGVAKVINTQNDEKGELAIFLKKFGLHIKLHHKFFGAVALMLTTLSIVTGIALRMNGAACSYIDTYAQLSVTDGMNSNPGSYYSDLPLSCKLSGGSGIAVVISTFLVFLLAIYRNAPSEAYWTPEEVIATVTLERPSEMGVETHYPL